MSKGWYLLGMISQVATKEAFQFIPPARYAFKTTDDHDLRHPRYARSNPCRMSGGTLDDGKAKPTSDDPSLGVKAACEHVESTGRMGLLDRRQQAFLKLLHLEDYWPRTGGLSVGKCHWYANARPDKLGADPKAVDGIVGRRRGKPEEGGEPTGPKSKKSTWDSVGRALQRIVDRYGSELFGNIIGLGKGKPQESTAKIGDPSTRISRADAAARLKSDFDRYYFVTGAMDLDLYEEDCTFADPFVAFEGRQRFKSNLDNLGSLMQDVSLDVTSWEEEENSIKTKWKFRCVLGLPWKPTLAAAGGTEFFFNQSSGRIERHVESWEIEPIDALKQLIRPGRTKSSR